MSPLTKTYISRAKDIEIHNHLEKISRYQMAMETLIGNINREKRQHALRMKEILQLESHLDDDLNIRGSDSQAQTPLTAVTTNHTAKSLGALTSSTVQVPKKPKSRKTVPSKKQELHTNHFLTNS